MTSIEKCNRKRELGLTPSALSIEELEIDDILLSEEVAKVDKAVKAIDLEKEETSPTSYLEVSHFENLLNHSSRETTERIREINKKVRSLGSHSQPCKDLANILDLFKLSESARALLINLVEQDRAEVGEAKKVMRMLEVARPSPEASEEIQEEIVNEFLKFADDQLKVIEDPLSSDYFKILEKLFISENLSPKFKEKLVQILFQFPQERILRFSSKAGICKTFFSAQKVALESSNISKSLQEQIEMSFVEQGKQLCEADCFYQKDYIEAWEAILLSQKIDEDFQEKLFDKFRLYREEYERLGPLGQTAFYAAWGNLRQMSRRASEFPLKSKEEE